jgi:hypothetical protein
MTEQQPEQDETMRKLRASDDPFCIALVAEIDRTELPRNRNIPIHFPMVLSKDGTRLEKIRFKREDS